MSREQLRAEWPGCAAIADAVREHFPDVKFLHGEEGGREIGKRPDLPAGQVWLDWTHAALIEAGFGQTKRGRK